MITMWKEKLDDKTKIGIVYVGEWYAEFYRESYPEHILLHPRDFIVGQWTELPNGKVDINRGGVIFAICKKMEEALMIFNDKKPKKQ